MVTTRDCVREYLIAGTFNTITGYNNMECDTRCYDNDIRDIYDTLSKNTSCPWRDDDEEGIIGFELFDMYMGEELN